MPKTLYDKIWEDHLVHKQPDGTSLIYVDRHLVHEVTSPQAFEGLRLQKRKVRKPELTLAVPDQVDRLIVQATSHENLSQLYIGWCPFW